MDKGNKDFDDYYQMLLLKHSASEKEIRAAYRRMAMIYHPDLNPSASEAPHEFRKITEAYKVLIDPKKRRYYDLYLNAKEINRADEESLIRFYSRYILSNIFTDYSANDSFDRLDMDRSLLMNEGFFINLIFSFILLKRIFLEIYEGEQPFDEKNGKDNIDQILTRESIREKLVCFRDILKNTLHEKFQHVKKFWDSVGGYDSDAEKVSESLSLKISEEEAKAGITKTFFLNRVFDEKNIKKRYTIKIPPGIKNGTRLKICDGKGDPFILIITID